MAITVVHTTSANSLSPTIPSTTAGNCLIVCVGSFNPTTPATISGITLGGVADHFAAAVSNSSQTSAAFIWCDPNCAGGQTAIVISGSNLAVGSGSGGVVIYEVSGLATSLVVDKTNSSSGGAGSSFTSGTTAITTVANEFWAGIGVASNGGVTGPSSPWNNTTPSGGICVAGQQVVSSTGTATYSGTNTFSASEAGAVVTLKGVSTPTTRTTVPAPLSLSSPYPLNLVAGSYAYVPQNPAKIPDLIFVEPNTATVTVAANMGSFAVNYNSGFQFPLQYIQAIPQNLRLGVFSPRPPTSSKAGVIVTGLTATVTVTANTGSEAINYPAVHQFPFANKAPWPLPVIAPQLRPQRQNQPRTIIAGLTAHVTVTAPTGSATPNVAGTTAHVNVTAHVGVEFTRINYAVPFPFSNYPYPLNLLSGIRPQNPASKPTVYVNGVTATVTMQGMFGVASALYRVTPQFPFTNLALPLPIRRLRQQRPTAVPSNTYTGLRSTVTVHANFGTIVESPHGNASAVTIVARTPVTTIKVSEATSNVTIASIARTTISISGRVAPVSLAASFGTVKVSLSLNSSVTVTPRLGVTKISEPGRTASELVAARFGSPNVSPHGNPSAVTITSTVHFSSSVSVIPAAVSATAVTSTPKITLTKPTSTVTVKAYVEGVAFAGLATHVNVSSSFGSISTSLSRPVSSVTMKAYFGVTGQVELIGSLSNLNWRAVLINPVVHR
jgi:hypothetical protein